MKLTGYHSVTKERTIGVAGGRLRRLAVPPDRRQEVRNLEGLADERHRPRSLACLARFVAAWTRFLARNPPCSTCPHEGKAIDYWHVQIDNDQRREDALNDVEDLPAITGVFERVPLGKEHFRHKFTNRFLIISRQGSTDCPSPRPSVTRHQSPLLEFTASGKRCTNQRKGVAKQAFIV